MIARLALALALSASLTAVALAQSAGGAPARTAGEDARPAGSFAGAVLAASTAERDAD